MKDAAGDLFFSGDGVSGIRLRADDEKALEALQKFAELTGLAVTASRGKAHAHLRSTEPPPEIAERFHLHQDRRRLSFFRGYEYEFFLFARDDGTRRYLMGKLQKLLLYGYAASLIAGSDFDLIHGALLEENSGRGTLLFGVSGIGKSTSVRRWRAAGKTAIADDMVFLYQKDGVWRARPMPTWSACLENGHDAIYDFSREIVVDRALLLLRDPEKERIGDVPARHYRIAAANAVSETSSWLLPYLPEFWRDRLAATLVRFTRNFVDAFPPQALFAHLDGDLAETLKR